MDSAVGTVTYAARWTTAEPWSDSWDGTTLNWSMERNALMSNPEYRNLINTYRKNVKKKTYTKRMDNEINMDLGQWDC